MGQNKHPREIQESSEYQDGLYPYLDYSDKNFPDEQHRIDNHFLPQIVQSSEQEFPSQNLGIDHFYPFETPRSETIKIENQIYPHIRQYTDEAESNEFEEVEEYQDKLPPYRFNRSDWRRKREIDDL